MLLHVSYVLRVGPSDAKEKLVLIALLEHCDEDGICWPSNGKLQEYSNCSPATITRKLRALERDGWLQRKKRKHRSNLYRVNLEKIEKAFRAFETRRRNMKKYLPPEGFDYFPGEYENACQVLEKSHNDQNEHKNDQNEHKNDHSDRQNLPIGASGVGHQSRKTDAPEKHGKNAVSDDQFREYLANAKPGETRSQYFLRKKEAVN